MIAMTSIEAEGLARNCVPQHTRLIVITPARHMNEEYSWA
jgi:hypothetical protein